MPSIDTHEQSERFCSVHCRGITEEQSLKDAKGQGQEERPFLMELYSVNKLFLLLGALDTSIIKTSGG